MDYATFLSSPEGLVIMAVAMAAVAVLVLVRFPSGGKKGERIVVLERKQASTDETGGLSSLYLVQTKTNKVNGNPEALMPDKVKMTVEPEAMKKADTLTIHKRLNLKPGVYRIVGREAGNLVTFAKSLSDTSDQMLDNAGMTRIINRRSLTSLARGLGGVLSDNLMYIILALMAGVSVGWVIYPYFNHAAPIIEYCTHLNNGTVIPAGCPG
jgi:hypothetical protein